VGPVLCLVTDRQRLAPGTDADARLDAVVDCVTVAAHAGVDLVQVRERDLEGAALMRLVQRCVQAVRGSRTRVLVNDRVDVALAAGAHGVHLPGHGLPAPRVRLITPRGFLIGRSVHHASEAERIVREGGVDYLVFGTVFPTSSKIGVQPAGVDGLEAAVTAVPVPVLAIGGVTLERTRQIARAGAAGFAAIGLFADACAEGRDRMHAIVAAAARSFGDRETEN
jgi:thiamine-phosphate diphosphorylase